MENYHLIQQIGEGSFGRVYKARRKYTGRMVAIKMINKRGQHEEDLEILRREIDILRKVDHPNIMRLLEIVETDSDICVISELGRGDLFKIIDDNQTLPEEVLQNIAAQLVSAMNHLHQHRIIHRDIKPQNVLIASNNSLKICDFGFARALSYTTLLKSIKGTPLYMAPELVQERPYDEKIDIWSLGIIFYELYYGKPPYYTNSIYKLIQMITNDPIVWPGPISDTFKKFLQSMLQKNPIHRASCQSLLEDPFIKNVKIEDIGDKMYRYKNDEFDNALLDPQSTKFRPPKPSSPDHQSILLTPSNFTPQQLLETVKQIATENTDSPLSNTFAEHFKEFLKPANVAEEATKIATRLLELDFNKYCEAFNSGIIMLTEGEMPASAIDFFTVLLVMPFSISRINLEEYRCPNLMITTDKAPHLRDRLFALLFIAEEGLFTTILFFISYLLQVSPEFAESFTGSFAAQSLPVVTSAIINHKSNAIAAAAFSILALSLSHNISLFQLILPLKPLLDKFDSILHSVPTDIQSFAAYSASLSFCKSAFSKLCSATEFRRAYNSISARLNPSDYRLYISSAIVVEKPLESCLKYGSQMPQDNIDIICYTAIIASPFASFILDDLNLDICVSKLPYLLPLHIPPTLDTVLSLPSSCVIPYLHSLFGLFRVGNCSDKICEFILKKINEPQFDYNDLIENLCDYGIIPAICHAMSDSMYGKSLPILLTHIVLNFAQPNKILKDTINDILSVVLKGGIVNETALIITCHFARLSIEYIQPMKDLGIISFAKCALNSDFPAIRARAANLIGNLIKYEKIPSEHEESIVSLLMAQLTDDNLECRKFAAYAIGNELYHTDSIESYVYKNLQAIVDLLDISDNKTIEYGTYAISNFIRKNDTYVSDVIKCGALEKIISLIMERAELVPCLIQPLSVFCLYDEGRRLINNKGLLNYMKIYAKKGSEIVKTTAQSILYSFDM